MSKKTAVSAILEANNRNNEKLALKYTQEDPSKHYAKILGKF
jgi:hypothetical protein